MPRFFFDITDGRDRITRDLHGVELPDFGCAEIEATEIFKKLRHGERQPAAVSVTVHDEGGAVVAKVPTMGLH